MKILHLMSQAGPAHVSTALVTPSCLGRHAVTLCTLYPGQPAPHRRLDCYEGTGSIRELAKTLRALLARQSFDIIHIHSPRLGVVLLIVALLSRAGQLSQTVLHVHGSYPTYSRTDRWSLLLMFLCSARITCCGHAARRSLPRLLRWCAGRRLATIRHSADLDLIDRLWPFRPAVDWTEPPPLSLVTAGRLTANKNQATILRALAQAKSSDVRLTVIGDGPLMQPLQALAHDLKLSARVEFVGEIPHEETLRRFWDADGFISMSHAEGLPLSALEAMGCFCPVVLSDIAAHREIRGRRKDLIPLIPATDVMALARAIDAWDDMPADVRRCWGADCRLHIESRLALTRMLRKLDDLSAEVSPATTPEWEIFCRCLQAGGRRR